MVGVGVDVNKNNLIGRKKILLLVSGSYIPISTTANITRNCFMCITLREGLGSW